MEFGLSEDQRLLQGSVTGVIATTSALDEVRKVAAGDSDLAEVMTAAVTELGTAQLMVPEAYDGLGLGALDAALVQEALGAHVSPAHFLAGSAMAVTAIVSAGSDAQRHEWLGKIASGEVRFAAALNEQVSRREGAGFTAIGNTLSGKSLFALESAGATHILASDITGRLYIVPVDGQAHFRVLTTIDRTRSFAELVLDAAPAEALSGEDAPGGAADRTIALARILLAADTLGAAGAMLEKAIAYAGDRKQFGRVIGSFQAVKHMCAEMAAKLEPSRALVWHAAYLFDEEPERACVMAAQAKAHLSEVGTFVARTATEVHGGMGFTDLVGLHYWFKRIGVNRQLFGGPEALRAEAARLQGFA